MSSCNESAQCRAPRASNWGEAQSPVSTAPPVQPRIAISIKSMLIDPCSSITRAALQALCVDGAKLRLRKASTMYPAGRNRLPRPGLSRLPRHRRRRPSSTSSSIRHSPARTCASSFEGAGRGISAALFHAIGHSRHRKEWLNGLIQQLACILLLAERRLISGSRS